MDLTQTDCDRLLHVARVVRRSPELEKNHGAPPLLPVESSSRSLLRCCRTLVLLFEPCKLSFKLSRGFWISVLWLEAFFFMLFQIFQGGDGGVIASDRRFMTKTKKLESTPEDPAELQRIKWQHCCHSGLPLQDPLVFDELGNIFNKEDVMKGLLEKTLNPKLKHIRRFKDFFPLHLKRNPNFDDSVGAAADHSIGKYICPISSLTTSGFSV